jgi:hypothetical protein
MRNEKGHAVEELLSSGSSLGKFRNNSNSKAGWLLYNLQFLCSALDCSSNTGCYRPVFKYQGLAFVA